MILINLLPPELRKKRGKANPILYAVAACWIACLLPALAWSYVKFDRLPKSQQALDDANAELVVATKQAEDVAKMEQDIAAAEAQFNTIEALVGQKMYWAPIVDEFANHLTNTALWDGFEVCCTDFSIQSGQAAQAGAKKDKNVAPTALLKGKYKLLGNNKAKAGDYIRTFFAGTQTSPFWINNGFVGRCEASYRGDTPEWKDDLQRVRIEFSLDWTRQKISSLKKKEVK